jgi:iron complex transport system substrate-binding protein
MMKRRALMLLILLVLIVAVIWAGLMPAFANAQIPKAIQVTDDRGVTVSFMKSPQRIVSLLPSLTESVCALDQCSRLVGVDRYSNWPARLAKLPQLGGGLDPNIEAIVALKPDVVLAASSSRSTERLESLGIKVIALEPKKHADVQRVLTLLGKLFDIPEEQGAKRVWREIEAAFVAASASIPAHAKGTSVYFEVNSAPYAAGPDSFMGETLARLGTHNIIPKDLGPFPKINPEFVVRANPQVIMVSQQGLAGMNQRPGWSNIRAIREHHVCNFSAGEDDILVRAGPRMAQAASLMAQCLQKSGTVH